MGTKNGIHEFKTNMERVINVLFLAKNAFVNKIWNAEKSWFFAISAENTSNIEF